MREVTHIDKIRVDREIVSDLYRNMGSVCWERLWDVFGVYPRCECERMLREFEKLNTSLALRVRD